ncbi:type IV pilus secretin PilQ [Arenimonas sp.]|uniref:type IV pilus secretin PilQ n=1 Tax=Arenimonas sp. TaxID=1872635 RepID=UPI0039C8A297
MKQIGESRGIMHALGLRALTLGLLLVSSAALADNVLQDVRYAAAPGGKVDITLQFANPVGEVQAFTTDSPPRIAIDLPNTSNGLSTRRIAIGSGATSAVSAAEAGGRTRVVVDLFRPAGYTTRSSGNLLVMTVDAGSVQGTASAAMANKADPGKRVASSIAVSNIDFKRGDNGSGRIILKFNGEGAAADMHAEGNQIVVDVSNAQIPENLRRRLDVTDFATPVQSVEPKANAGSARLVINTNGSYETMAYQTGNEYVLEISPKRGSVIGAAGRAAGAVNSAGGTQRYAGKPVTFNFQDVPVRTVLQLIAEESNLNIVASDTVQGNVTLRLINVPWDQALEIVLRARSLDKRRDGNVVWVAPQKELSDFEQAREDARIAIETRQELVSEYIAINYGNAEDIAKLLTENSKQGSGGGGAGGQALSRGFLSPRGSVSFDNRTNTLLVIDIPKKIQEIKDLLKTLDRPVDQVLIEARVVIADETFARDLGARFGVSNPDLNRNSISNVSGSIEANQATINSFADAANDTTGTKIPKITDGFLTNLAVPNAAGSIAFSLLRASSLLDLEFSALETEGRGEIISNPRVITSNQREAIIRQGDEIGYVTTTVAQGVSQQTVAFKEALLELKVTPTITQDGRVYLVLALKKDDVKSFVNTNSGGVPSLTKREISTAVLVDNGQTVVIGGVYEFKNRDDVTKVPWLGDVPFLGNMFRKKGKSHSKAELLIFVTPRVLAVPHH